MPERHINETNKRRTSDEPKTSVALKRLWHAYREEENQCISLKEFAKARAKELNKEWQAHKHGSLEKVAKAARLKNKGARIALERSASKAARRKVKGGGGKPTA